MAQKAYFQKVGDRRLDRSKHVWRPYGADRWKCVLCGGITVFPSDDVQCPSYEVLTVEDRGACPPAKKTSETCS